MKDKEATKTTKTKKTGLELLRVPFSKNQIGLLPKPTKAQQDELRANKNSGIRCQKCGGWHHKNVVHLEYVGHAAITDRLLEVDSNWSWEPVATNDDGTPKIENNSMWIRLTICGVTRLGYGDAELTFGKKSVIKEIIGDAIRNAGMRFGLGLNMWHKGELHEKENQEQISDHQKQQEVVADKVKKERVLKKQEIVKNKIASFIEALGKAKNSSEGKNTEFGSNNDTLCSVYKKMLQQQQDGIDTWNHAIFLYDITFIKDNENIEF